MESAEPVDEPLRVKTSKAIVVADHSHRVIHPISQLMISIETPFSSSYSSDISTDDFDRNDGSCRILHVRVACPNRFVCRSAGASRGPAPKPRTTRQTPSRE